MAFAPIFQDEFEGANGTLVRDHAGELNATWADVAGQNPLQIASGELKCVNLGGMADATSTTGLPAAFNLIIAARFVGSGQIRIETANEIGTGFMGTHWLAYIDANTGTGQMQVRCTFSPGSSYYQKAIGFGDSASSVGVEVRVHDGVADVYVDGTLRFTNALAAAPAGPLRVILSDSRGDRTYLQSMQIDGEVPEPFWILYHHTHELLA